MSTKTTNLEMTLLAEEDNFDTNVYNENFQKTDDKIGELNSMLGSEELTTTAQTHSGAINELNKKLGFLKANALINGDLNDYHDYIIGYSSSNLLNGPGGNGFIEVLPYSYDLVMQRFTIFGYGTVYVRFYNAGTWSEWKLDSPSYSFDASTASLYISG